MAFAPPPTWLQDTMAVISKPIQEGSQTVKGYDFNGGIDLNKLLGSFSRMGFQATNFSLAVDEINKMIDSKMAALPEDQKGSNKTNCTIFLSFTSNMMSCGMREIIKYLVQHKMVDCIVTTAGGIEEDFIKCMADTYLGAFHLRGKPLRLEGHNRTGNLLVPSVNYSKFQDWLLPILDQLLIEQKHRSGTLWTPSKLIARLGKEIDHKDSVYYWAYKNNIPVYSPGLTDGSFGDIFYLHSYLNPGLVVDIVQDICGIDSQAVTAVNSGLIILGGGLPKHHICNANIMRDGANFSVCINTASEYDGSDSGARPDEAVSWGKIKMDSTPVKVFGDASLIFPLLVSQTFAKREQEFHISGEQNGIQEK